MEVCPQPLSVWLVGAITTGICSVLAALATFIRQIQNDHRAAERHAVAQRARELVRDEIASITGNGHSEKPSTIDDGT